MSTMIKEQISRMIYLANSPDAICYNDNNLDLALMVLTSSPARGMLLNNQDGTFAFDPRGEFDFLSVGESATEMFTYEIKDKYGRSSSATVAVTVTGVNDGPDTTSFSPSDGDGMGMEELPVEFIGAFSDPDMSDERGVVIQWDDGAVSRFALPGSKSLSVGDSFSSTGDGAVLAVTELRGHSVEFRVEHSYRNEGLYTVVLSVSDFPGELVSQATAMVEVTHGGWQNHANPLDADASGTISPLDALVVINALNRNGGGAFSAPHLSGRYRHRISMSMAMGCWGLSTRC